MNTTWKITKFEDGEAVASVEGVNHQNAVEAIRNAMYGYDPLADIRIAAPQEQAGASFLVPWFYDQRKFPDIYGYLPQFRRIRQFPANQRFEPLVPGAVWFLSDPWAAGDPSPHAQPPTRDARTPPTTQG